MITANKTHLNTYKTIDKSIQTSRLDNVTFKSSSFAPKRPENFDLSVDGKDASFTPVTNYLSGLVASFLGNRNNSTHHTNKNSNHISYLA